ncbi:MAG: ATPase, T2SS/T4P/T4SS family [Solirubrobacteraceae bacterium]|jgi:type IV pilus assembly protein PilB
MSDPIEAIASRAIVAGAEVRDTDTPKLALDGVYSGRRGARIGDIVVELGFCSRVDVEASVRAALESGRQMGEVLLERNLISADQLATAMAERFGLEHGRLEDITVDIAIAQLLPVAEARRLQALPVNAVDAKTLTVAIADPANILALDDVSMFTGRVIRPVVVSPGDFDTLLRRISVLDDAFMGDGPVEEPEPTVVEEESADDAPTIRLVRSVIAQAVDYGASDIHFDPDDGALDVRYRIDGVMAEATRVRPGQAAAVISRIKILAEMDISERRLPQDGRIGLDLAGGRRVDIRVAVMPLVDGESAALRILDTGSAPLSLDALGMSGGDRAKVSAALRSTHGAILSTGPTGSGKTTSLYAMIGLVSSRERMLMTIEDPVEYRLAGVNQIQVTERIGLTFSAGLRAIVRADPDVIMVGEIRDRESAQIAVDAALTGHLVLSTLHTNDAPSAPMRLLDMGVEPFVVASAINCVIAQRLARRVCTTCRRAVSLRAELVGASGGDVQVYESVGCARCRGTGFTGRVGLFEVMPVTDEIRTLIAEHATGQAVARLAAAQGMVPMRTDGLIKVRAGDTTLAELGRVLGDT